MIHLTLTGKYLFELGLMSVAALHKLCVYSGLAGGIVYVALLKYGQIGAQRRLDRGPDE